MSLNVYLYLFLICQSNASMAITYARGISVQFNCCFLSHSQPTCFHRVKFSSFFSWNSRVSVSKPFIFSFVLLPISNYFRLQFTQIFNHWIYAIEGNSWLLLYKRTHTVHCALNNDNVIFVQSLFLAAVRIFAREIDN